MADLCQGAGLIAGVGPNLASPPTKNHEVLCEPTLDIQALEAVVAKKW